MEIKIYEFIQICTIDGFDQRTKLFLSEELARKEYNDAVETDEKDVDDSVDCRSVKKLYFNDPDFNNKVEDGDFVIDKEENEYMSYNYGNLGDGFVSISLKEHKLKIGG